MRIFGYGSLIWDGWQSKYNCLSVQRGTLPDHQRAFNKASVKNWGSKLTPGPTLNVVSKPGATCEGLVFEFADADAEAVMRELIKREGGFEFPERGIRLASGEVVQAQVPIYSGSEFVDGTSCQVVEYRLTKSHYLTIYINSDNRPAKLIQGVNSSSWPRRSTLLPSEAKTSA